MQFRHQVQMKSRYIDKCHKPAFAQKHEQFVSN